MTSALKNRLSQLAPPAVKDPSERAAKLAVSTIAEDLNRRPIDLTKQTEQKEKRKLERFWELARDGAAKAKLAKEALQKKGKEMIDLGLKNVSAIVHTRGNKTEVEMIGNRAEINTGVERPVLSPSLSQRLFEKTKLTASRLGDALRTTAGIVKEKFTTAIEARREKEMQTPISGVELAM